MRTVICETPGTFRIVERPVPEPEAGEVLVKIKRMGVCGTDLHIFNGKHPFLEYPRVIGHELSGEVAATGEGGSLAAGTPVYIMPYLTCGTCIACRKGKSNCCTSMQVLGVHCDGGMTDYIVLPERIVFSADGIPLDQAALIEFLAIGAHAARRSELKGGERTLVVGAGPIGLATATFARKRGADVTLVDPRDDRLRFAADELGFQKTERAGPGPRPASQAADRWRLLRPRDRCDRQRRRDGSQLRPGRPWRQLDLRGRRAGRFEVLPTPTSTGARSPFMPAATPPTPTSPRCWIRSDRRQSRSTG